MALQQLDRDWPVILCGKYGSGLRERKWPGMSRIAKCGQESGTGQKPNPAEQRGILTAATRVPRSG